MSETFDIKNIILGKEDILRERLVNYIQQTKNILDSYPSSITHGVQKDAIQNGWDACVKKTRAFVEKNWKFEFELLENINGKNLLLLSDYGTYGLTGKMTGKDIGDEEILPEEERWARWESLAFPKIGEENLGARGQGKMILIAASRDYAIAYDSLREDGTYRMGVTQATVKGCPILHFEEESGKRKIKSELGIDPIDHIGTRVIILNPVEELISSIKNGELLSFIEETWWPIIHKLGAKILIKYNGNTIQAKTPVLFPVTKELGETKTFKTWVKENTRFNYEKNQFTVKRICFACDIENDVAEIHRGIAVFRGGMKVATILFPDRTFRNRVYGYVEFDERVDRLLRALEMPNHYGFREKGAWRKIKEIIEDELQIFGNKKLGLGIDTRELEKTRRNTAENKAMSVLRIITKDWPFAKRSRGTGGGGNGGDEKIKKIGIKVSDLEFPNPGNVPRLNYGEKLEGFYARVFNKTDIAVEVVFRANVLSGDRIISELDNQKLKLKPKEEQLTSDGYSFSISKKLFPAPGEYRLRFTLTNAETKQREDEVTRRFWVETDPELKGPFDVKPIHFSEIDREEIQKLEWYLQSEGDNRQTLLYNLDHPAYQHNDETEERLTKYLSEIFCMGALKLLIRQAENEEIDEEKAKKLPFQIDNLLSKEPRIMYDELTKAIGIIKSDLYGII